jgi:hypothetical protein
MWKGPLWILQGAAKSIPLVSSPKKRTDQIRVPEHRALIVANPISLYENALLAGYEMSRQ